MFASLEEGHQHAPRPPHYLTNGGTSTWLDRPGTPARCLAFAAQHLPPAPSRSSPSSSLSSSYSPPLPSSPHSSPSSSPASTTSPASPQDSFSSSTEFVPSCARDLVVAEVAAASVVPHATSNFALDISYVLSDSTAAPEDEFYQELLEHFTLEDQNNHQHALQQQEQQQQAAGKSNLYYLDESLAPQVISEVSSLTYGSPFSPSQQPHNLQIEPPSTQPSSSPSSSTSPFTPEHRTPHSATIFSSNETNQNLDLASSASPSAWKENSGEVANASATKEPQQQQPPNNSSFRLSVKVPSLGVFYVFIDPRHRVSQLLSMIEQQVLELYRTCINVFKLQDEYNVDLPPSYSVGSMLKNNAAVIVDYSRKDQQPPQQQQPQPQHFSLPHSILNTPLVSHAHPYSSIPRHMMQPPHWLPSSPQSINHPATSTLPPQGLPSPMPSSIPQPHPHFSTSPTVPSPLSSSPTGISHMAQAGGFASIQAAAPPLPTSAPSRFPPLPSSSAPGGGVGVGGGPSGAPAPAATPVSQAAADSVAAKSTVDADMSFSEQPPSKVFQNKEFSCTVCLSLRLLESLEASAKPQQTTTTTTTTTTATSDVDKEKESNNNAKWPLELVVSEQNGLPLCDRDYSVRNLLMDKRKGMVIFFVKIRKNSYYGRRPFVLRLKGVHQFAHLGPVYSDPIVVSAKKKKRRAKKKSKSAPDGGGVGGTASAGGGGGSRTTEGGGGDTEDEHHMRIESEHEMQQMQQQQPQSQPPSQQLPPPPSQPQHQQANVLLGGGCALTDNNSAAT